MPMSCCMCEPMKTAWSLGDHRSAVGTRPKWAREHRLHSMWPLLSVGEKLGPSTSARTRTWADVNVRLGPLANVNRLPSRTRQRRHAI